MLNLILYFSKCADILRNTIWSVFIINFQVNFTQFLTRDGIQIIVAILLKLRFCPQSRIVTLRLETTNKKSLTKPGHIYILIFQTLLIQKTVRINMRTEPKEIVFLCLLFMITPTTRTKRNQENTVREQNHKDLHIMGIFQTT